MISIFIITLISIFITFKRLEKQYTFVDTAGVRRKSKIKDAVEKFSIIKTLQAIHQAHVVIVMLDAQQGVTDQDIYGIRVAGSYCCGHFGIYGKIRI